MNALPWRSTGAAGIAMLAATCGASLLVMRCFAGDFGVIALLIVQAAAAAGFLGPWLRDASRRRALKQQACRLVGLSLLSCTLPFALWACTAARVGSGPLAVAHASLPLAVTLAGAVWLGERVGGRPFAGFVVGLGGAALLSWQWLAAGLPSEATAAASAAVLAPTTLALAAASFAALCSMPGRPTGRRRFAATDPIVLAIAAQGGSALTLLLPAAWLWPDVAPQAAGWGRVLGLGVAASALGFVLYHGLSRPGPRLDERRAE
ncbi:EamA family transporter [uncultured Piscinibacter sp.]|uniref:EamA family transporter n=1 Tax=uncultured Piscinibacter sp. TaxID=1131835 RepID=UPI00261D94D1|nr:EamA family transporter [uncultured Piscinibacter sp.]